MLDDLYTTWYTAGTARRVCGQPCCAACGQLPHSHHPDGRCYTPEDRQARLAWYHRTGRWPRRDYGGSGDTLARLAQRVWERQAPLDDPCPGQASTRWLVVPPDDTEATP